MSERHTLILTQANLAKALRGVSAAVAKGKQSGKPWTLELREARRTDEQNSALWGLLAQIQRQRPTHNGVAMTAETWKSVFLQALGAEMVFVPTLDGTAMFPLGHRSSQLTKAEFTGLLELILAWCAKEQLVVEHFDDGQGPGSADNASPVAA